MNNYDPLSYKTEDYYDKAAGYRIGKRIHRIREKKGLTQAKLSELVGLPVSRIQQYECGARKPKLDLLLKIAETLEVCPEAFMDPITAYHNGVMFALFEMENLFDLKIKKIDDQIHFCFGDNSNSEKNLSLNQDLEAWYKRHEKRDEEITNSKSEEEKNLSMNAYYNWEWNYPKAMFSDEIDNMEYSNEDIDNEIEALRKRIDELENLKN